MGDQKFTHQHSIGLRNKTTSEICKSALVLIPRFHCMAYTGTAGTVKPETNVYAVEPLLRDHSYENPPVFRPYILSQKDLHFNIPNLTCHQRPPVLRGHIFLWPRRWSIKEKFYCTYCKIQGYNFSVFNFTDLHLYM